MSSPSSRHWLYVLNRHAVTTTAWVADLNVTTTAMRLVSTR